MNHIRRMKRPDVRMAWREKVTIFWLLMNAIVIFYIVEFGRLLCPNFDKAWSLDEVNQHTGGNDFWVAIQGVVYDVTKLHSWRSQQRRMKSNSPDILAVIAGQDLTYYFPPPLVLGCSGLVTDDILSLTRQNWTDVAPLMHHVGGKLQTTKSRDGQSGLVHQHLLAEDADHEKRSSSLWLGYYCCKCLEYECCQVSVMVLGHVPTSSSSTGFGLYTINNCTI